MAARILGIDLGAYSVKVVVANPGFRQATVADFLEKRVQPGTEPQLERSARALGELVREARLGEVDSAFAAMSGDKVFLHILDFDFKHIKRADLERVVGAELEGVLPIDLEDMVYAFETLPRDLGDDGATPLGQPLDDEPTFVGGTTAVRRGLVAEKTEGTRVLTAATHRDRAANMLETVRTQGLECRGLIAAPASYARVVERLHGASEAQSHGHAMALIDIGHQRTDVCVVQKGRAVYARTISRGGHNLTESIAKNYNLPYDAAEDAKHRDGYIGSQAEPPSSPAWARIHEVLSAELLPLARDLKRTLGACRAKCGAVVERAVIVGGGSRLRGLDAFLSEQMRIPVELLTAEDSAKVLGQAASTASGDVACLAAGVAFEGSGGRPAFDLRQGSLAFKADLSFLRAKAWELGIAALVIFLFVVGAELMNLQKLRKARETLEKRVAIESVEVLGEKLDADEVIARLGTAERGTISPVPDMTAYDLLLAFNAAVPPRDQMTIDVDDLEIEQGKITVKGSSSATGDVDALKGMENLEANLQKSDCFKDFNKESQPGAEDSRRFTLTIQADCKE